MSTSNYPAVLSELRARLNAFLEKLPTPLEDLPDNYSRIGVFIYFLTILEGEGVALKSSILQLFDLADINRPANVDRDFRELRRVGRIIPLDEGFRLHRREQRKIEDDIRGRQKTVDLRKDLLALTKKIPNQLEREFIEEAVRCFATRPPSKRATVVLTWITCVDHLQNFVLGSRKNLTKFNSALITTKQRVQRISKKENFSDLDESVFIQKLREARLIDTNIHKQLNRHLGFRDSCAHPNTFYVSDPAVEAYIEDSIKNILVKFK